MKDQLFILRPGFFSGSDGPFYCSDAVAIEGVLSFFPQLRSAVEVEYIDAPRPRTVLVEAIGEENQSTPVLVLGDERVVKDTGIVVQEHEGKRFINAPDDIQRYLSSQYGVARAS